MREFDPQSKAIIDGLPKFSEIMKREDMVALLGEGELYEWNTGVKDDVLLVDLLYATLRNKLISKTDEAKTHMSKIIQALRLLGE